MGRAVTVLQWAAATLVAGAAISACRGAPSVSSLRPEPAFPIVIILVDAMRADRTLAMRNDVALAPNIAALAAGGVLFRNGFASAPKTIPSVPQILTSRYFPDLQHETSLLTVCRDAGYVSTGAFVHNPYVTKWTDRLEPSFDSLGGGELDAAALTGNAIEWLSARKSDRIAMYVHYLDVHVPLKPPAAIAERLVDESYRGPIGLDFHDINGAWQGLYGPEDQRRIEQLYDAAVAATDVQIGRLLDALRKEGLFDRALIVLTSDHGEELWDHGGFFHGHTLYDELLHVPLIVKFPGGWAAGTAVDSLARTVDILPTIADLLDRASPEAIPMPPTDGESLVPLVTGESSPRTLFATIGRNDDRSPPLEAVRTANFKLIHDMRTGTEEFYDVVRDPAEQDNLVSKPASADVLADLRRTLEARLETLRSTGIHIRLANGTASPVPYKIRIGLKPVAPFFDLAGFDREPGDVLSQNARADGMSASGVLAPGDHDELRFSVLSSDATVLATFTTEANVPFELCMAGEECVPSSGGRSELPFARIKTSAAPPLRSAATLRIEGWMLPGESEPITNLFGPADRERLRSLGYAE